MEKRKTGPGRNTDFFEQHAHLVAVSGVATTDRIPAALLHRAGTARWTGKHRERGQRPESRQGSALPTRYQPRETLDF